MDVSLNEHNQDEFLESFPLGSFLQSRFWKRFLRLQGKKTWQLSVYDDGYLVGHALLYTTSLPLGKSYLYAPKGPIILPTLSEDGRREAFELMLSQIRDITIATRRREEIFCRIEPNIQPPQPASSLIAPAAPVQPPQTIYLELSSSPEETFSRFKEKTRYNIRLAEKKGVTVRWSTADADLNSFLKLMARSAKRNHIRSHEKTYYRKLLEAGKETNAVSIAIAEINGAPIAANIYCLQYPTITYLHGGFDYRHRDLMAPYLLQWSAIQRAYEEGYAYFDFWGYAPDDGSKPSWAGFSRFKEGFGGTVVASPGCFDFVYNPFWYNAYTYLLDARSRLLRR